MDEFTSEQKLSVAYEEDITDLLPTELNLRSEDWSSTSEYLCESESVLQGELCESLVEEIAIDQDNASYLTELGDPVIDDSLVYVLSGPVADYAVEESPFEVVQPLMMETPLDLELLPPGMEASPDAPVQSEEEEDTTTQEVGDSGRERSYSESEKSETVLSDVDVLDNSLDTVNFNEFIGPLPLPQTSTSLSSSILYQPILPKAIALNLKLAPPPPPQTPPRSTTHAKDSLSSELPKTPTTPIKTSVLGKEQIKKRLQSFSLMKQGIQPASIKKPLIKSPAKVQIQVQKDTYDEDGNLYEQQIVMVQKPKKQVPVSHGERARAVIDEIERIKKEEQAIYEEKLSYVKKSMQVAQKKDDRHYEKRDRKYSSKEYFNNRSRHSSESDKRRSLNLNERHPAEVQYKEVKHKEIHYKEEKLYKDEKLHKEEKQHKEEKPYKEEKLHKEEEVHKEEKPHKDEKLIKQEKFLKDEKQFKEEKEELMPLHWKEFKDKDFDFKKMSTLKEKIFKNWNKGDKRVQKRSQEKGDKTTPQIVAKREDPFDTPSWPRQSIAVIAKDETFTYYIAPELVKFTEKLPSISWSNKQVASIGFLKNRKQIISENSHKRTELMMKIIENNTGIMDKDYGAESTINGYWYSKEKYLEEANPKHITHPSDALLVLSEVYDDPIDEVMDEKKKSKTDSGKKGKHDVEEKKDKSLKNKSKSKKKKSKSKHKKSKSRSKSKDKYSKTHTDSDRKSKRKKKKDKRDKSKTRDKSKSPEKKVDKPLDSKAIVTKEDEKPKEESKPKEEKVKEDILKEEKPAKNKSETNTPNTDEYRSNWESDEDLLHLIRVDQSNSLDKSWEIDELDEVGSKKPVVNPQIRRNLSQERKKKFESDRNDRKKCNSSYLLDLEIQEKAHDKREFDLKTELENKRTSTTRFTDQKKSRTSSKFEETLYSDPPHRSFNKGYEYEDREHKNPITIKDSKLERPPKHEERSSRFEPYDSRRSRDFETRDQKQQQNSRDRLRHTEEKGRKSPEMHTKKYKEHENVLDKRGKQYNDNMDDRRGKQYTDNMEDKRGKQYTDNMEDKRGKQYTDNMEDKRGKQYTDNMEDKRGKQYTDNMEDKRGKQYTDNMEDKRGKQYIANMEDKRGKQYIANMEDKRGKQYNDHMDNKRGKYYNDERSFRKSSEWDKKPSRDSIKDSRLSNERSRRSIELEYSRKSKEAEKDTRRSIELEHSRKSRGEEKDPRVILKYNEEYKRSAIPKYRDTYNHEQELENNKRYSSTFSNYRTLEESRRENKYNKRMLLETSDVISVWSSDEDIHKEVEIKHASENQKSTEEELYLNYNRRAQLNAEEELEKKKANKLDGVLQLLGKGKERQSKWDEEEEDKCQVLEKVLEIRQSNLLDISKNVKKLEKRRKSKDSDDSKASRSSRKGKKSKKQSKENRKKNDSEPEEWHHISNKDDNKKNKKIQKAYKIESKVTLHYSDLEDSFEENTKPQKTEKNDDFSVENEKFSKYKSKVKIDYSDFDLCLVGIKEKLEDIDNKSIPSRQTTPPSKISTPSYTKINLDLTEILEQTKDRINEDKTPEKPAKKPLKTEFQECTSTPVRDEIFPDDSNSKSLTPPKKLLRKPLATADASSKLVSEYEEFMKAVSFEEPKTPEKKESLKVTDIRKSKNDDEHSKKLFIEDDNEDDDDASSSVDSSSDDEDDTSDEEESSDSSSEGSEDSDMSPSYTSREEILQTVAKIKTEKLSDDEDKHSIQATTDKRKRIDNEMQNQYVTNVVVKTENENIAKKAKIEQSEDKTIIDWEKNYTYPNKSTHFPLIQSKYSNPMFGISDMIRPENIPLPSEQVVQTNKPILTNIEVAPIVSAPISIPQNISSIPPVDVTPIYNNSIIPIRLLTPEARKQVCTEMEQHQLEKTPTPSIASLVSSSDTPPNFGTPVMNSTGLEDSETITLSRKRQCQWNMNLTPVKKPLLQSNVFGEQESDDDLCDKILKQLDKSRMEKDTKLELPKKLDGKPIIDSAKDDKTILETRQKHFVSEIDKNKVVDKEKDKMEKERSSSRSSKDRTEKEPKKDGLKKDEIRNDKRERSRERQINKDSFRDNRRRLDRPENRSDRSDRRLSDRKTFPKGGRRYSRDRSPPPRGRRDRSVDRNRSRERERSLDRNKSRDRDRSRDRERNKDFRSGKESDPKYNRNSNSYKKQSRSPTPSRINASGHTSDFHNYNDDSLLNFRQTDTDFSVSSMDIVHSPVNSPLDGFKRSLADSTISDSELLTQQITPEESNEPSPGYQLHSQHYYPSVAQQILPPSTRRLESPSSPKRLSLDDRINLVLGIEKEPPKPIDTVCTRGPFPTTNHPPSYHQDPYNTYNRSDYDLYNQDPYAYSQNNQYQQYYNTPSASSSAQPATEPSVKVLQVGNVIQVVPTEQPPPIASCSSSSNLTPVPKAPEAPPKVVQVGNMLQIVPVSILETPVINASPVMTVVPSISASEKPGTKVADQLMLERKAEKEKRRLDREARRNDKEKKRKEKEKRKQLKIKLKTENMIKRALLLETGETDLDISTVDHDTSAEILDVSVASAWPPMNPLQVVPLPKAPGKGILVSHGFREKEDSFRDDTEPRKVVKFADGICPGEGTSPSAGEELPSPPPPPRKLPKEKRYKKTKLNSKNKKKVKVKIIRTQQIPSDESDAEDLLPPPPPPPGSPPPHLWPPRIKTTINNIHPQLAMAPNTVYPPPGPHYAPNVPPPQLPHSTGYHPPPQMTYPPVYPPVRQQMPVVLGQMPPMGSGPTRGLHPPVLPVPGAGPMGGVGSHGVTHHGPPVQLGPPGPPMFHH